LDFIFFQTCLRICIYIRNSLCLTWKEHRAQSTEHRAQSTEHRAQSTEHRAQEFFGKKFSKKAQGQGTIEYLIIIAIVIVIALVVVGLMSSFLNPVAGVGQTASKIGGWTNSIALTETSVTPDGNYLIRLANNSGEELTISNVKIGDTNADYSQDLFQGNAQNFVIDSSDACSAGDGTTNTVTITYVSKNGITKNEVYPADAYFSCENYTVSLLADQCSIATYDGNATAGVVRTGYDFYAANDTLTNGSLATQYLLDSTPHLDAGYYDANDLNVIDTDLIAANISSGTTIFGVVGAAAGGATLHTGQTTSYDTGTLDDKEQDGAAKSYTDNSDGTVTDNHTGLVWQKDHKDNGATLTWEAALTYCNTLANGVDGLTDGSSTGDWRVPSFVELATLADYSYPSSSYLNSIFTQTGWDSTCYGYWSSTTLPSVTSLAYVLTSDYGYIGSDGKTGDGSSGARCVRSE